MILASLPLSVSFSLSVVSERFSPLYRDEDTVYADVFDVSGAYHRDRPAG